MEYFKDFENWHKLEIRLELSKHKAPQFKEGDVWWVSIGVNLGNEICGKGRDFTRPVIILVKLNRGSFLGVPLTSTIKKCPNVKINGRTSYIVAPETKLFSVKRLQKKIGRVNNSDFRKIAIEVFKIISPIFRGSRSFRRT